MASVIEMPKLSDTMEEGGIANWLKKEGDAVKSGEPLVEIETDKATQEFEAPASGILVKILVPKGQTVALRTPIGVIAKKDEKVDFEALLAGAKSAKGASSSSAPAKKEPEERAAPADSAKNAAPAASATIVATDGRIKSSPLARKVAADRGIDLRVIHGSGPGGRIVVRDLEQAAAAAAVARPSFAAAAATSVPLSMMRKTIAKRLTSAKNEAPHFYLSVSADATALEAWRQKLNAEAAKSGGALPKVSVNDIVILAVSRALRQHPAVNASWQGDAILMHNAVHISMAVALPEGLVTPVIRDADRLGLRDIARQAGELAAKAKAGKAKNEDFNGGTFSISNLGMFGIESFTAIINPPQAAILAVGAAKRVPHVNEAGELVAQLRMNMTMSCDHRVIDGATGAQFLQTLVRYLEDPASMLA